MQMRARGTVGESSGRCGLGMMASRPCFGVRATGIMLFLVMHAISTHVHRQAGRQVGGQVCEQAGRQECRQADRQGRWGRTQKAGSRNDRDGVLASS